MTRIIEAARAITLDDLIGAAFILALMFGLPWIV